MRLDRTALRSKVARRIFMLFVSCALVPIACLAVLSYTLVTRQLNQQSQRRLYQASKSAGMGIVERLHILDASLERTASTIGRGETNRLNDSDPEIQHHFRGLTLELPDGETRTLLGKTGGTPPLWIAAADREHIASGRSLLSVQPGEYPGTRLFLSRAVDPNQPARGMLAGEIDTDFLWSPETLPVLTELLVLDASKRVLFSSLPAHPPVVVEPLPASTQWILRQGVDEYLASSWSIPLKYFWQASEWKVVLGESRQSVLAPMKNFKTLFPLVILLSLWLVLLFSISQIRRNLIPLEKLREGTKRIARREFESRVQVASGDEFEDLADSFNAMAFQLDRQFNTLATMAEMDRAILSTLDTHEIVNTVLTRLPRIISCDGISITLLNPEEDTRAWTYCSHDRHDTDRARREVELIPSEIHPLRDRQNGLLLESNRFPGFLTPLAERGADSALVLPIFLDAKLSAVIALGYLKPAAPSQEDQIQARRLADRMAVAISKARLLEELHRFSWGTLVALARTIDAKSPWTLGHCERGASLAVKIGRALGLGARELDDIHRGALLHDIGKIAIPPAILDNSGRLTDEERQIMQEHPRKGARILEPIAAFQNIIPIVSQHHERWDGTGYPNRLAGEQIELSARIYAVADVFDAMTSDRPYRAGSSRQEIIEHIKKLAGHHFDPQVVQAFLKVMEEENEETFSTPQVSVLLTS